MRLFKISITEADRLSAMRPRDEGEREPDYEHRRNRPILAAVQRVIPMPGGWRFFDAYDAGSLRSWLYSDCTRIVLPFDADMLAHKERLGLEGVKPYSFYVLPLQWQPCEGRAEDYSLLDYEGHYLGFWQHQHDGMGFAGGFRYTHRFGQFSDFSKLAGTLPEVRQYLTDLFTLRLMTEQMEAA